MESSLNQTIDNIYRIAIGIAFTLAFAYISVKTLAPSYTKGSTVFNIETAMASMFRQSRVEEE